MSGAPVTDLAVLLARMAPVLNDVPAVYVALAPDAPAPDLAAEGMLGAFREAEGWTVIAAEGTARALDLPVLFEADWITLQVPSALEAVGLTAAVAAALGDAGLSCNVVAAARHDHVFVPRGQGARAVAVLRRLSSTVQA